jgi:hypothetical protein
MYQSLSNSNIDIMLGNPMEKIYIPTNKIIYKLLPKIHWQCPECFNDVDNLIMIYCAMRTAGRRSTKPCLTNSDAALRSLVDRVVGHMIIPLQLVTLTRSLHVHRCNLLDTS